MMKHNRISTVFLVSLMLGGPTASCLLARPAPHAKQRAIVKAIVYSIGEAEEREEAVQKLMSIVQDSAHDTWLRVFAAEELGQLGAAEAQGVLVTVAEQLKWTDGERRLRSAVHLASCQIRVAIEPNRGKQIQILREALSDRFDGLIAWPVQIWAGAELANMGVAEAMPEVIASIRRREPPNRAEKLVELHQTKVKLLSAYASRMNALAYALAAPQTDAQPEIKTWAIGELAKLRTEESVSLLATYALELQNRYYDTEVRRKRPEDDPLSPNAGRIYREVVLALRSSGIGEMAMKRAGVDPKGYFRTAP